MLTSKLLVCFIFLVSVLADPKLKFPHGFQFGAATSSYQVEGAWNVSDKSESIWDRFTHITPEKISDGNNGDVACDSYKHFKRDVEMLSELGAHFYRFSISWPRLMPTGFPNKISEDGKKYYNELIDELISKGVQPLITLYHWDLPQSLQDLGGWTNPLIVGWFEDYARVVYSLYADRVKTWITINEPVIMCDLAYGTAAMAPGVLSSDIGAYLCTKHTLLAHAKAYRLYKKEFEAKYHGQISIANQLIWGEKLTDNDEEAAELFRQYSIGLYTHPIYSKEGGWPPIIEKIIEKKSKKEGYNQSRLPPFTKEEIELVKGTYDYNAVNYYTSRVVRFAKEGEEVGLWPLEGVPDIDVIMETRPNWPIPASSVFAIYPKGLRHLLAWLKDQYGDMQMFIAENGYVGDSSRDLQDDKRVQYLHDHLEQILLSIHEDGVNVTGYTVWTLLDNFEWMEGYSLRFGLYEVDFSDPERKRTPRKSASYYSEVIKSHSINVPMEIKRDEL